MIGLGYILNIYGISNADLAKELGITRQNVSIWLSGERKIPKKYLPILSKKFGISEEYFISELSEESIKKIELYKINNPIDRDDRAGFDSWIQSGRINLVLNETIQKLTKLKEKLDYDKITQIMDIYNCLNILLQDKLIKNIDHFLLIKYILHSLIIRRSGKDIPKWIDPKFEKEFITMLDKVEEELESCNYM